MTVRKLSGVGSRTYEGAAAHRPSASPKAHWTTAYLGRPHVPGGCWLLFREVQAAQFGRTVDVPSVPDDLMRIVRAFEKGAKEQKWAAVTVPHEGDGVLMSESEAGHHVGTYVELPNGPRVLHSLNGQGVALHTFEHIKLARFNIVGFYRPLTDAGPA